MKLNILEPLEIYKSHTCFQVCKINNFHHNSLSRQRHGIVKVLENDNEYDFYEEARRTPRKVRFGGEQVKLRTPESDSSNQDDDRHTLTITVSDALSIRTKKSLIPVRITSLPATPKKQLPQVKKRLHKSTSDLSKGHKSKIPLKKDVSSSQEASASSDKRKREYKVVLSLYGKINKYSGWFLQIQDEPFIVNLIAGLKIIIAILRLLRGYNKGCLKISERSLFRLLLAKGELKLLRLIMKIIYP